MVISILKQDRKRLNQEQKGLDKIILGTAAIIYNPIFLIQLGSGLAWGTVALLLLIYSCTRMLSRSLASKELQNIPELKKLLKG